MQRIFLIPLLLVLWPSWVLAQYVPYAPPDLRFKDPRARRTNRERAVVALGTPEARAFVESHYGDQACAAIFACSQSVGQELAELHASGDLGKLPKPAEILRVIGFRGDDAAKFVIHNTRELQDPDCTDAFLARPLEFALGLERLEEAASQIRASRETSERLAIQNQRLEYVAVGSAVLIIAFCIWRYRCMVAGGR
jgi:hypothetical protein